ncbi:MAG TPA: tripartite tricarboxylate transporter substrate binding protein [Burkholderiales bacterium]
MKEKVARMIGASAARLGRGLMRAICALALCLPQLAAADAWPAKPVRFIVPFPAGGSADVAARVITERLAKTWNQPVIVENRPGASTILGTNALVKAAPDGYTFSWVTSAHAINPSLYANLPYDTLRDFAGVTLVYALKPALVAAPDFPAGTVDELVALAKAQPGKLSYASPATGSSVHLVGELFKLKYGVDILHIGYKGSTAAHPDVMSGRVPLMFDALPNALPHIKSGKLKLLAVVSNNAVPGYPEFPLLTGLLPANATVGWNGIVVPAKTPREMVARLNADIVAAVRSPEVQERFAAFSVDTIVSTPERFDAFIREDVARWAEVVKRAGVKIEQGN